MKANTKNGIPVNEIFIQHEYKTTGGFIRAVRNYMAKILGEYPEDVLTAHYNSNEEMEAVLRRTGSYYYESREINIDVKIDSHIYICAER